mmetsp:Transcript_31166/g.101185  ORF Transcript_31166/g.101185 Transcript_31166/m.101185 type:complete len:85 (+) Transcript_31166:682-936(+)
MPCVALTALAFPKRSPLPFNRVGVQSVIPISYLFVVYLFMAEQPILFISIGHARNHCFNIILHHQPRMALHLLTNHVFGVISCN